MKSSFFIVALLFPFTLAAPVDSEEKVLTPAGLLPASNVHAVPEGGSINITGNELQLLDASKKVVHTAQVNVNNTKETVTKRQAAPSQWIIDASWLNTGPSPISYFTTTWSVPPAPVNYHGQTIFLFNGLEPATPGTALLQPVLQYGPASSGGGPYWLIANWYLIGEFAYYTQPTNVTVGQVLEGIMELDDTYAGIYSYSCRFANIGGSLNVFNSPQLAWAFETLEAYNIAMPNDYPVGSTVFSNINLFTSTGTPSVNWTVSASLDPGVSANVLVDGATNAVIEINYPIRA